MSCDTTSNVAQPKFIAAVCVLFGVIPLVGGALLRAGKRPPQSLPYLISLLARRILLPLVDVAFDWVAVASYWSNGQIEEAVAILTFLIVGTLSLTMVSAFASTDDGEYQNLRSVKDEGPVGIACGCCAGIFQVGPLYLGGKAIRAWREVTDTRWRKEALYGRDSRGPTTQPMLNDFVALVANVKHFIHFEALFEGGPQLVLQASRPLLACTSSAAAAPTSSSTSAAACTSSTSSTASIHLLHHLHLRHSPTPTRRPVLQAILVVRDWETLRCQLSALETEGWVRLISPLISAAGLVSAQVDWLCEGDRFIHRVCAEPDQRAPTPAEPQAPSVGSRPAASLPLTTAGGRRAGAGGSATTRS